jgi:hypothetical protein
LSPDGQGGVAEQADDHLDAGEVVEQVDALDLHRRHDHRLAEVVPVVVDVAAELGMPRAVTGFCNWSMICLPFRFPKYGLDMLLGSNTPDGSLTVTVAVDVSVWSNSVWRPRRIVMSETRKAASLSILVHVGVGSSAGSSNATRTLPAGI